MVDESDDGDFYEAQSIASQIKIRIVTKYFAFWSKVMIPIVKKGYTKKLAYIDFYSGPGVYKDGTPSTPLLILKQAVDNSDLSDMLVTIFNDEDPSHATTLEQNIAKIDGIKRLKHYPKINNVSMNGQVDALFNGIRLVPTFTFVDPFGYKGVTLNLLRAMLKDWGCDLLLFFSYNRINAAITNSYVEGHVEALFGRERLDTLREELKNKQPLQREALILEAFAEQLKDKGFRFVLPFTFAQRGKKRTSHYLIFVSKHELAYKVMKEIMAKESSDFEEGVPSFAYSGAISAQETPLLFQLARPIEDLGRQLMVTFAGRQLSALDVFNQHHVDTRYISSNYKDALIKLEQAGKISAIPPLPKRPKRHGKPTMADKTMITFPEKGST